MKKIDLGQAISILANIGVIAGIVFLAFELRQNNELIQIQVADSATERARSFSESVFSNPGLAAALVRFENSEELSAVDEMLLRALALRTFRGFEARYREHSAGRLEEPPIALWIATFQDAAVINYGMGAYWEEWKHFFQPDFVQFMDENVVNQGLRQ